MRHAFLSALGVAVAVVVPLPAAAETDEAPELWLNPSVSWSLDDDTAVEIETAQRLRREEDGRPDTYFVRLWLNQDLSDSVTVSGGVERRANSPGADETRVLQQLSASRGVLRTRMRLEQRFIDDRRMGLRFRPRLGVELPVGESGRLAAVANAELFLTLRSTSEGGDQGLTGLRTQVGASYEVSDRLSVSLAYLRQQEIQEDAPDRVGHAPLIGVELSF